MFAAPPPLDPPPIAAEQQGDFDCLRVATMLGKSSNNAGVSPWAPRLLRIYLNRPAARRRRTRLAGGGGRPAADGLRLVPAEPAALHRALRGGRSIRPTQAAPPVAPQPTGG